MTQTLYAHMSKRKKKKEIVLLFQKSLVAVVVVLHPHVWLLCDVMT
jgi:hypothetical protein